jgi:hypothetical protein
LEDIEMMSGDSVGLASDNMGASLKAVEGVPGRALSPILEVGNSSRAPTPMRPRSPTPKGVEKGTKSRRSNAFEASGASSSESTVEIKLEGANWTVGGKLAKLGGNFKSNPFKAVVDLVDHDGLRLKRDITLCGVAEEMLTMQCLVSVDHASNLNLRIFFLTSCLLFCRLSSSPRSYIAICGRFQLSIVGRRTYKGGFQRSRRRTPTSRSL